MNPQVGNKMEGLVEKARMVELNGRHFEHVKPRSFTREGDVFRSWDREAYLRTGKESDVWGEANITRELRQRGFPVPKVLEIGEMQNGFSYYVESSMGTRTFVSRFKEETERFGQVQEETFKTFTAVVEKFFEAQCRRENLLPQNLETLEGIAGMAGVMSSNPPPKEKWSLYTEAYGHARQRLSELPWGFLQTDLTSFNVLERGVIDLERVMPGPIGYDVVSGMLTSMIRNPDLPAWNMWCASNEQFDDFMRTMDAVAIRHGIAPVSGYSSEFLLLKLMQMSGWGKRVNGELEQTPTSVWRTSLRDQCVELYARKGKVDWKELH